MVNTGQFVVSNCLMTQPILYSTLYHVMLLESNLYFQLQLSENTSIFVTYGLAPATGNVFTFCAIYFAKNLNAT